MEVASQHYVDEQYASHLDDDEEYDESVELVFYDNPEGQPVADELLGDHEELVFTDELQDDQCGSSDPPEQPEQGGGLCQRDYNFDVGPPNSLSGSAHVLHIWWENGAERFDCGYSHTKYEGLTVPICFQVPLQYIERFLCWLSSTADALPTMDQWFCSRSALGDLNQMVSGMVNDPALVQHIFSTIIGMRCDLEQMTPFPEDMLEEVLEHPWLVALGFRHDGCSLQMFQAALGRWQPNNTPNNTVPTSLSVGPREALDEMGQGHSMDTGHGLDGRTPTSAARHGSEARHNMEAQHQQQQQHYEAAQPATSADVNDYNYRETMSDTMSQDSHGSDTMSQVSRGRSDSSAKRTRDFTDENITRESQESVRENEPLVVATPAYTEEPLPQLTSVEWRKILEMESVVAELEPVAELVRFSSMADSVLITVLEGHQQRLVVNSSKQQTCVWGVCATSLEESICKVVFSRVGRTIEEQRGRFREVLDTRQHPELTSAPLVVDGPCIRYYLGFELIPGLAYICLLGCTAGRPPKIQQQVAFRDFCSIMMELCTTKRTSVERLYSTMIKLRQEHPEATCWKFSDFRNQ